MRDTGLTTYRSFSVDAMSNNVESRQILSLTEVMSLIGGADNDAESQCFDLTSSAFISLQNNAKPHLTKRANHFTREND
jgi:hypothetical protein